jgi:hypothetical protein
MADTINTGTMLIEEGTLIPGSLRFESEPWTPFYMAGEIIRESRKACGEQNKYASKGNMAHPDAMIARHNHPCDVGSRPKDDSNVGIGLVGTPESGDAMELQMNIKSKTQLSRKRSPGVARQLPALRSLPNGLRARYRESTGHQEHGYRPRAQPSPVQPCSMQ